MTTKSLDASWFRPAATGSGRRTVVLFPPAGGGSSGFRRWADVGTDNDVDIYVVTAPGREHRVRETPYHHVDSVLRVVVPQLEALPTPLVLFGHSMGGLLAAETAARLSRSVDHVVVAASPAPAQVVPTLVNASDADLVAAMRSWGGTPDAVLDDEEMLALLLPCLRGDIAVGYSCLQAMVHRRLPVPFTALAGRNDATVPVASMRGWEEHTSAGFRFTEVSGGHFFPFAASTPVVDVVLDAFTSA
ncbi:MAG: alpha/beta fold hydrolase [Actinomycetota bacterium]